MPLETILRKLKWKQPNSFDLLNDKMQKEGKFAILLLMPSTRALECILARETSNSVESN